MDNGSESVDKYLGDDEDCGGVDGDNGSESVDHAYCNSSWNELICTYDPIFQELIESLESSTLWCYFTYFMQLIALFWLKFLLLTIVKEKN